MSLSVAQLVALKADIIADPVLNAQPNTADGAFAIAAAYNLPASLDFWVWRTSVTKNEITQATSQDGTTFNWTGTGFITRSQGERDAWRELFEGGSCNPSLVNTRQAFQDIFSSATPPAPANRTHLLAVARRKANRAEKLFATGTGSTGAPATMNFEGAISIQDVQDARNMV